MSRVDCLHWFVIESNWGNLSNIGLNAGWGNGYVKLPKSHPLFGEDYDVISEKIKWQGNELTYADFDGKYYTVGFDTNHYGMDQYNWSKSRVEKEAERLSVALFKYWLKSERKIQSISG